MHVDPRRVAILLTVHRAGGVLAAADVLRLTPSAISQQIARLEAETGTAMLDRQPSGAVLTAAGRVLADAAERIESELLEAERALVSMQEDITGRVTIGAFQTIIRALLVPLVADLHERLPGVELVVRELDDVHGQRRLRDGTIDLLVIEGDSPAGREAPRGMRDVTILDEPWLVVLPPGAATPATLQDLENASWLAVDPRAAAHQATERIQASLTSVTRSAHEYSDYDVALAMVAGGLGVAILPSLALHGGDGDQVQVTALAGTGTRHVIARHRTTRSEPRQVVRAVLDEIVRAAGELAIVAG
ncbi:MAG: LysR family transcriptional regulator [Cellulomonadaceae bacterium]